MINKAPEGHIIDIAPILKLAGCFGFDKDTFEASIEGNHIIISIDGLDTNEICEITESMAN